MVITPQEIDDAIYEGNLCLVLDLDRSIPYVFQSGLEKFTYEKFSLKKRTWYEKTLSLQEKSPVDLVNLAMFVSEWFSALIEERKRRAV